jgi:hypothetical protein
MPKLGKQHPERREHEQRQRERDSFEAGFRPSRAGNPWRKFDGRTVTIFTRDDEDGDLIGYGWCISAGAQQTEFSQDEFDSVEDAMEDVADRLGVGI